MAQNDTILWNIFDWKEVWLKMKDYGPARQLFKHDFLENSMHYSFSPTNGSAQNLEEKYHKNQTIEYYITQELILTFSIAVKSRFVICTHSSNWCRIIATLHDGNRENVISVDEPEWKPE